MAVIQYKCPQCGSDLVFDAESGMLSCDSCGYRDSAASYEKAHPDARPDAKVPESEDGSGAEDTAAHFHETDGRQYQCNNCGAILITDNDTTATSCSFCGAPMILGDRLEGELAPVKIIPFQISREEARTQFRKWCRNGRLTPKGFMTADRIKNITGMYVPYWLYDIHADGTVRAECTRVRSYDRGEYTYTQTSYYDVYRKASLSYKKVPADASEKLNDEMMDRLEPFRYEELEDFRMPYLAGYVAEKYNYTSDALLGRVKNRVSQYAEQYIRQSIRGYSTTVIRNQDTRFRNNRCYYTLLPVWMVCYDYKDSEHTFLMNGQTGKIVGKPPISRAKVAKWFSLVTLGSFIGIKLLAFLIGGVLW